MPAQSAAAPSFAATPVSSAKSTRPAADPGGKIPASLLTWYLGLIPYWMEPKEGAKRRLQLRAHQWVVDRVLAPQVSFAAAVADLRPDGELTQILTALVPAGEAARWRHFIGVLVANLRHAMQLPVTRRNEAWVRWLFLIPFTADACSIPRRPTGAAARPPLPK